MSKSLVLVPLLAASVLVLAGCVPTLPAAPPSSGGGAPSSGSGSGDRPNVTSDGWEVTGDAVLATAEADVAFHGCPAGSADDLTMTVWGVDVYTGDSPVCIAAVHAGIIAVEAGGVVKVTSQPGLDSYEGSTRHGVTTSTWGNWPTSFTVAAP